MNLVDLKTQCYLASAVIVDKCRSVDYVLAIDNAITTLYGHRVHKVKEKIGETIALLLTLAGFLTTF